MAKMMRRLGVAIMAILAIPAINTQALADVAISKSYSYFSLGGRTAEALDRELSRRGPKSSNSKTRHAGLTQVKFGYDITFAKSTNRCSIKNVKVKLSTKIILPKWRYRKQAGKQLALIWDTLSADIKRHEDRHAEIARNHARKMDAALKRLPSASTCEELERRAEKVFEREYAAHDKDQSRFDRVESSQFERRMIRLLEYRSKHYLQ